MQSSLNFWKGIFSSFKRKKAPGLKPLKVERPGIGFRIAKASQKKYIIKMGLLHNGQPLRQFDVKIKANSRDNAALKAQNEMSLKVISSKVDRSK